MKNSIDAILKKSQAEYLDALIPPRDVLLAEMEHLARAERHPIADPEVAQLMRILVRLKRPMRIIEVGTSIGYSVVTIGRECGRAAVIETIELNREILETARRFVDRAKLPCEVIFHQGAALEVLPKLRGPFDFAFIDCVKAEYTAYLDELLLKLSEGAVIVFDNLLWKGEVAEMKRSTEAEALRELNARLMSDPRLLSIVLPLSDGVGISLVR